MSLEGSCHCGAIRLKSEADPSFLTQCNCSTCHRFGALWFHDQVKKFSIEASDKDLVGYQWGDHQLTFYHCQNCGCVTHWTPVDSGTENPGEAMMAINVRMVPRNAIEEIAVKRLDGADTWQYLD